MSETKKTVKYKFGQSYIDLDHYLYNLGTNVQSYIDSQNWTDGQKQEFISSYNKYMDVLQQQLNSGVDRFSTDDFGGIIDSAGEFSDEDSESEDYYYDDKGNQIDSAVYNSLKDKKKKKYKKFSANKAVAYYFNRIGKAISAEPLNDTKEEKKETKEKFDVNKHGFLADWQRRNNVSGGPMDLKPYLDKDVYDPNTGKRSRTGRLAYLAGEIDNYLKNFKDDQYDYTDNTFANGAQYREALTKLRDHLKDNQWTNDDIILANQAGISSKFYNDFFTEAENPSITVEQQEKAQEERKKAEAQEEFSKYMQTLLDTYNKNKGSWYDDNAYTVGKLDYYDTEKGFDGDAFRDSFVKDQEEAEFENTKLGRTKKLLTTAGNVASWIINPVGRAIMGYIDGEFEDDHEVDMDAYINEYLQNPYTKEGKRALSAIIGAGRYETITEGPYSGMLYIPQEKDKATYSGLVYDPSTHTLRNVFLGNIPNQFNRIRDRWKEEKGLITPTTQYSLFKQGGNIQSMQIGGGFSFNEWMKEDKENNIKARAQANNRDLVEQKAGERRVGLIPGTAKVTVQNPDAGFTGTDMLRLSTIAADIVAMGAAFVPGYGTAASAVLGAGSSLGTFFADAFEDGLDGGDFGNLATNLGLDFLGLIPGGGAASKGAKIAKTLGRYATRIIATIGAIGTVANGDKIIASFNKLSNPSELTVDDWRNISAGIGLITGGTAAGTRKFKKHQLQKANTKADSVAVELTSKNGTTKTILFGGDDAKAIRRAGGDVDQIKAVTSKYADYKDWDVSTELGMRWKGWKDKDKGFQNPLGKSKAKVMDVIHDYNMFGKRTGKMYAKRGRFEEDVELTSNNLPGKKAVSVDPEVEAAAFADLKKVSDTLKKKQINREKLLKNYSKTAEYPLKGQKDPIPENELPAINTQRENRIKALREWLDKTKANNYKTKELMEFEQKHVKDGKYSVKIPNSEQVLTGTWSDIVKKYGLRKEGGTINIIKVRQFSGGGKGLKTNTTSTANWFTDIYSSPEMRQWLDSFTSGEYNNFEKFNELQRSWAQNKRDTKYSPKSTQVSYNQGVYDRQGLWNATGNNAAIQRAIDSGKIISVGNSGDNAAGNYQDGYFGEQEFLRHGGTKESWQGREAELAQFQEMLREKGLTYTLDEGSGMYLMGKLDAPTATKTTVKPTTTTVTTTTNSETEHLSLPTNKKSFNINPTLLYGLPRAFMADKVNRRLTDMAKASEIPLLQEPYQNHRSVYSDLGAEMQGQRAAAALHSMASRPITSDASLQLAAQLDAANKGQEFIIAGKAKSDDMLRTTAELAWKQEDENAKNRHNVAVTNRDAIMRALSNKSKHEQAYLAKKHEIWDTLGKQLEYDHKTKLAENKTLRDNFAKSEIHNAISYNLKEHAKAANIVLTPGQLEVWNKVLSGTVTPSSLTGQDLQDFMSASKVASQLEQEALKQYYGISDTKWSGVRTLSIAQPTWSEVITNRNVPEYKKGAKIAVAGIKARTADAERFQKSIKAAIDRNEKILDRVSKSLYKQVKPLIIK